MKFKSDDIIKSCRKLESGLRLGSEGIHACQLGPFCAPIWWTGAEAAKLKISRDMIAKKRKELFFMLNDNISDIPCKQCFMVFEKPYKDVKFTNLGHVDVAADTICNLRCTYCGYAVHNNFSKAEYDPLTILKEFSSDDVEWDSAVDFNGGEPTLLKNFNEYIKYFNDRKVRIFLYTNAVIYSQAVYDGLVDGSIRWVISSLDAGSPASFLRLKKRDKFLETLQTLTRYAHAGSQGGGNLAVKYIFSEDNCTDDDITGFTYAMLAIRPQKVWLTFDFEPIQGMAGDSIDFGGYDYSQHIFAYVRTYLMLQKHGLEAGHFTENHLAAVCNVGKNLMDTVRKQIAESEPLEDVKKKQLCLNDFREPEKNKPVSTSQFSIDPFQIVIDGKQKKISLSHKKVMLAPASDLSKMLLNVQEIRNSDTIGFLDCDIVLQGKLIDDIKIYGYETIQDEKPEYIFVAANEIYQNDIINSILKYFPNPNRIIVLRQT